MIIFIVSFLSFILEYIVNGLFHGTIFSGLIIFSSMVILEPYFKKEKNKFFAFCFILGFLFDLIYTGTYFLNAGLFLSIGVIISFINRVTPNNFIVTILELIFLICIYRIFSFMFMFFNGIVSFDFDILCKSIYCYLITNVLYGSFLYFILYLISLRFKIKRIN